MDPVCRNCGWNPCQCKHPDYQNLAIQDAFRKFQKNQIVRDLRKQAK